MSNFNLPQGSTAKVSTTSEILTSNSAPEDLSSLFNYPSIGQLFSETDLHSLQKFRAKMNQTFEDLERVIRRGSKEDAEKARRVADAIKITLEFLSTLEQARNIKQG